MNAPLSPSEDPNGVAKKHLLGIALQMDTLRDQNKASAEEYLKGYLNTQNLETAAMKRAATDWVKEFLARTGYGLEYEGKPCRLFVNIGGTRDRKGQFRVVPFGSHANSFIRATADVKDILDFKLINAFPSLETVQTPTAEQPHWQDLVQRKPVPKQK